MIHAHGSTRAVEIGRALRSYLRRGTLRGVGVPRRAIGYALPVLAAVAALAACATPQSGEVGGTTPSQSGGVGTTTPPPAGERRYDCNHRPVDPVAFAAARPAASLPAEQIAIIESATLTIGGAQPLNLEADQWIVVASSHDQIDLMQRLSEGDPALDPTHDWEHVIIGDFGTARWTLKSSATCALNYDVSPLTAVEIRLDPSAPPDPSSRDLALLVTERECNSGQDAEGRVRLIELIETAGSVKIMIGVDPTRTDGATAVSCPANPPTPFTVTLAGPLGDRAVLNGNLVDSRPIEP